MRHFYILVLSLFFSLQLLGQELTSLDKITLNTGEVYLGEILVKTTDLVMIKVANGSRYQFQLSDVKEIEKSGNINSTDIKNSQAITVHKATRNLCGQIEFAGGLRNARNAFSWSPDFQGSLTLGNKNVAEQNLFMGIGLGYNSTKIKTKSVSFVPVFGRIQGTLNNKSTSPYIALDGGYAFSVNPNYGGGVLAKLSIGIIQRKNQKVSFIAGLYGSINSTSGNLSVTNEESTFTYNGRTMMQSWGLKLGIQF